MATKIAKKTTATKKITAAAPAPKARVHVPRKKAESSARATKIETAAVRESATDAVDVAPARTPLAAPSERIAVKPLAVLGVEHGLFLAIALPAAYEPVKTLARLVEKPLPHLASDPNSTWMQSQIVGELAVYVGYVAFPDAPAGPVKLGLVTESGRKTVFDVNCLSWRQTDPAVLVPVLKRYAPLWAPGFRKMLEPAHPLLRLLPPEAGAAAGAVAAVPVGSVRGSFDGIVDELAHGWVFDAQRSGHRIEVEVLNEGEVVGRGLADRYREDLESNGVGDGRHHFRVALSSELFDGRAHELQVRVPEAGDLVVGTGTATLPLRASSTTPPMLRTQMLAWARAIGARLKLPASAAAMNAWLNALRAASFLQELGDSAASRAAYSKLLQQVGDNAVCHVRLGEMALQEGSLESARRSADAALACDRDAVPVQIFLGDVLRAEGKLIEAEHAYAVALDAEPRSARAGERQVGMRSELLLAKARALTDSGQRAAAIELLSQAVVSAPDDEALLALLRDHLLAQHGTGEARRKGDSVGVDLLGATLVLDAFLALAEQRLQRR